MYEIILIIHSWLRWVVLLTAIAIVVRAAWGWKAARPWDRLCNRLSLLLTISVDVQLLLGLLLYVALSPITTSAIGHFGKAMKNPWMRFWTVEHTALMLLAIVFVHIGKATIKKADSDLAKSRRATVWFGLALLMLVTGIPWPFMQAGRALFNLG